MGGGEEEETETEIVVLSVRFFVSGPAVVNKPADVKQNRRLAFRNNIPLDGWLDGRGRGRRRKKGEKWGADRVGHKRRGRVNLAAGLASRWP